MAVDRAKLLSATARARKREMLPGLLSALRRRRRRQKVRATAFLAAAALVAAVAVRWAWLVEGARQPALRPPRAPAAAAPFVCEVVHDDPAVLQRYRVTVSPRDDWLAGDDELQAFLRASARPDGLVRIAGRVTVVPAAVDRLPLAVARDRGRVPGRGGSGTADAR